jgi:hypothetical protein
MQEATSAAIKRTYDFGSASVIADIGGGYGYLISSLLASVEQASGVLFDQPHVIAKAEVVLRAAGVDGRCRTVPGDFRVSVPVVADVYILKHVLHDWDDVGCTRILRMVAAAMPEEAKLLVIEHVLPDADLAAAQPVVMLDLHMMAVLGGRERTQGEFTALLREADLSVGRVMPCGRGPTIIEATRRTAGRTA